MRNFVINRTERHCFEREGGTGRSGTVSPATSSPPLQRAAPKPVSVHFARHLRAMAALQAALETVLTPAGRLKAARALADHVYGPFKPGSGSVWKPRVLADNKSRCVGRGGVRRRRRHRCQLSTSWRICACSVAGTFGRMPLAW